MKTELFFYTGTGNSFWTARTLSQELGDTEILPMSGIPGDGVVSGAEALGLIFPVHMWGLPRKVIGFANKLAKNSSKYYFAVAVNAGQVAATVIQLKKLMISKPGSKTARDHGLVENRQARRSGNIGQRFLSCQPAGF